MSKNSKYSPKAHPRTKRHFERTERRKVAFQIKKIFVLVRLYTRPSKRVRKTKTVYTPFLPNRKETQEYWSVYEKLKQLAIVALISPQ